MHGSMSLNGTWGLTWAEGAGLMPPEHFMAPALRGRRLLDATVPAPIHQVLLNAGLIEDPNIGLNSLKARWVEEQFWVYRHTFTAPADSLKAHGWLVFDRLEFEAEILLNGEALGRHANAHRPACFDVTGKLRSGENLLVVKLSTGMHSAADKPGAEYSSTPLDLLTRRPWQRKPQYQCGWDWNPRLMNVGILGDVRIEWCSGPRLDQVTVFAVPAEDLSSATLTVRATVEGVGEATPCTFKARIRETGQEVSLPVRAEPGENRFELTLDLDRPRLWWPIGCGEQALYTVEVSLAAGKDVQTAVRRTGVRRIEIDQSPHPDGGRHFILKVNSRPVFCKGANWVPADLLYSTVTAERYRKLVELAVAANFNMLRVWGGGLFADPALCDACDELGILIWHDFLFACAKYPGDDPDFAAEVRREVTWAARQMAHHPSIAVWCGNNEIEWGDWAWGYDTKPRTHPHYAMFHHDLPAIMHREVPSAAYWISSPYSPDFLHPNDPTAGDQHPWGVSILTPGGADFWTYRTYADRFANEGGVLGASSPATLWQFLVPEPERRLLSATWDHHDNPLACTDSRPGEIGHAYATVELWTGRDPLAMSWEDYAFASALCQAEGLQEYIHNYRRRMFSSAAAVFWMYNDSWPVTHGWTIVDYYLRKKLAYHPVRRAFAPITAVVVDEGDDVAVYGVNETDAEFSGDLRYGVFLLAGGLPMDERKTVTLAANAATPLARFSRAAWKKAGFDKAGTFAVLCDGRRPLAQHRLFVERFKDLVFAKPVISLTLKDGILTLESEVFVWGVCLDVDGELPLADNCFDLLPGIPYVIPWGDGLPVPKIVHIGSRDAVGPR